MTLKNWLFSKNITQIAFAERLGITKFHLNRIVSGKLRPGKLLREKIELLTKGQVKFGGRS